MKIKNLFLLVMVLFVSLRVNAQQPYAGCWHPEFIKDWTPEKDPDAKFNVSSVPLQPRIKKDFLKVNRNQSHKGQVGACLTMHPSCSQVPSQGADNFIGYNPSYWQYMDLLIWWGGSAGEGIILPPSAPVIDAAHLNGVKVLGQVFFSTRTHGGDPIWTQQMLTEENGTFPYARKLVEIAQYYGFDGWFINDETTPGDEKWNTFVKDYLKYSKEKNLEGQEIQYYRASPSIWEKNHPMLKEVGASYFVDYGWVNSESTIKAAMNQHTKNWGLSEEDAFYTYYWGILQTGSLLGSADRFQTIFPANEHAGSIQIFNPEEKIWKEEVQNLLNTEKACGKEAYKAMEEMFKNEARFWTNRQNDPSDDTDRQDKAVWPGLANAIIERSAIESLPFVSTFSAGLGKHRFVNGDKKDTQDWYHRGMQTVIPIWRWWMEYENMDKADQKPDLNMSLNFEDAYNMGTSVSVKGKLIADEGVTLRLFKTNIKTSDGGKIQVVYKTNTEGSVYLKLGLFRTSGYLIDFPLKPKFTNNGWSVAEVNLSDLMGMPLGVIALGFKHDKEVTNYEATLGQIAIYPKDYNPSSTAVSNLKIQNELSEVGGNLRVVWDKPTSDDVHHFNVYLERNGKKSLVGQTRNEGYFIPTFARSSSSEKEVKVYVTAVNKDMKEGSEISVSANFPTIKAPVVQLKAEKTLIKKGEEVKVIAKATNFPTEYVWITPEGGELVSSNGNIATFKFTKEGIYDININVKNEIDNTNYTESSFIKVSDSDELENISRKKQYIARVDRLEKKHQNS